MQKNIKIVIADDMDAILQYLEKVISEVKDFEIVGKAQNGIELVELVIKYNPDIVLTDIEMPECSGIEAIEELDKLKIKSKYVIMTGNTSYMLTENERKKGVLHVIRKPILDDKKLIEQIKQVVTLEPSNKEEKTEDKEEISKEITNDKITRYKKENIFTKIINRIFGRKNNITK